LTEDDVKPEWFSGVRCFDFTEAAIRREPLRSAALRAAQLAQAAGCLVVYAVNYRSSGWAGHEHELIGAQRAACSSADVVILNADEATLLTQEKRIEAAGAQLLALGPRVVAITNGEKGTHLATAEGAAHVPAFDVRVRYDVGAGDAFHAGLVAAILRGLPALDAARFASAVAALKISRPPRLDFLPTWAEAASLAGLSS
ncbi:MAG: bifunctional hydroxymethylpyrimidine kinase/phosphomethylpyrimidine kinase, partial [Armatimonadetes bacterium]|nr:bifunctional hydroxymethylpyrimidine kinase/phosphomethylpyrimidine kinase [Armatimonadota bacterium]